jgi:pyridoxamine 5'-phosphate oxidase
MDKSIADLRKEYTSHGLDEPDAHPDPFEQFERWFADAVRAGLEEANAMTLATATNEGAPSARMVLMKSVDAAPGGERGFTFFTNYESRKSRELDENPRAALVFYWKELSRQVRATGRVEKISAAESDAYFAVRPFEAQVGAWASEQSQALPGRAPLEARFAQLQALYAGKDVPRPPHWGGWRLIPDEIEFWQGRPHRLHDRLLYRRQAGEWSIVRLAP